MRFWATLFIFFFTLCLMLASVRHVTTGAVSDVDWSVTIYDHGRNALVELSPAGSNITYLPDIGFQAPSDFWGYDFPDVKVTDAHDYLVTLVQREDPYVTEAVITNLATRNTVTVPTPPMPEDEMFIGYVRFGAFNTYQTQITLPYVSHDMILDGGCCNSGGIVTVDLASGNLTHTLDIETVRPYPSTAWVDAWTDKGIWFAPRCNNCTPAQSYHYSIWNPKTDAIIETTFFHDYRQAERLESTGEVLYSASHPEFPLGGPTFPILLNTVTYQPLNTFNPSEYGQVISYDTDFWAFDFRAHWAINGRAFLVTKDLRRNVVVMRDGRQLTIDYAAPEIFIAMTGDGWLTIDRAANTIQHYAVNDDEIVQNTLFQVSGEIEIANIHLTPSPNDLPPFEINIAPPEDVAFCPGAMPTQFQPRDWAEVIVDHRKAWIAAFELGNDFLAGDRSRMELLPLGAQVQILEGPKCTPNGWSYVKVRYQDRIGWMLEVFQTTYYLAPASPLE